MRTNVWWFPDQSVLVELSGVPEAKARTVIVDRSMTLQDIIGAAPIGLFVHMPHYNHSECTNSRGQSTYRFTATALFLTCHGIMTP